MCGDVPLRFLLGYCLSSVGFGDTPFDFGQEEQALHCIFNGCILRKLLNRFHDLFLR